MPTSHRQRVIRADGRAFNIVQHRAHLTYCYTGCCCGITERGYAAVPVDVYTEEWLQRKMRNDVHLTKGGCLGPCALANVVSLVFDGRSIWFHSVNSEWQVRQIFEYIDAMLKADRFMQPPAELTEYVFNYYDWDVRLPSADEGLTHLGPVAAQGAIMLLSHADTDLLTLIRAAETLPEELRVSGYSLNAIRSEDQMNAVIAGEMSKVKVIVVRCHGPLSCIPGFDRLKATCVERGQSLILVSGTGDNLSEFAETLNAPSDVMQTSSRYLDLGGVANFAELFRFLSDRLMLTGLGYAAPAAMPEHGIYLPDMEIADWEDWQRTADTAKPTAAVLFYRAHRMSGNTLFVDALVEALRHRGMNALCVFTSSLKSQEQGRPAVFHLIEGRADVLISTLSFALAEVNTGAVTDAGEAVHSLERLGIPVVQAIASGMPRGAWEGSRRGLNALDTAVNVAIPEFDGRIISVPLSFKERSNVAGAESLYVPHPDRVNRVAGVAARLAALRRTPNRERRVAFVLTNSAAKAAQVGGAVGLDTPASLLTTLHAMRARRYSIPTLPQTSDELMQRLLERGTYDGNYPLDPARAMRFSRASYRAIFDEFPARPSRRMQDFWGQPQDRGFSVRPVKKTDKKLLPTIGGKIVSIDVEEPWGDDGDYLFAAMELGNALIALQPPRGYGIDPDAIYHTPDLPPTHHYTAFYRWLGTPQAEGGWGADAIVHMGKHGTLEWLPGKGIGLSGECYPDLLLGDLPLIYPFIINDPGEGSQSKRRAHAVIVDHLTPPMTSAETYGPLAELNQLINEYYAVEKLDPTKLPYLQQQIWEVVEQANLKADLDMKTMLTRERGDHTHEWDDALTPEGIPTTMASMTGNEVAHLIEDLDGYLCELGMAQIRDGLHVLGQMPPLPEMLRSLTRLSNMDAPSLPSSMAEALGLDAAVLLAKPGERLGEARLLLERTCYTHADVLEVIDRAALDLFQMLETLGFRTAVLGEVQRAVLGFETSAITRALAFGCELVPKLEQADDEIEHLLDALEGRYIPAGPAGAPTRGMAHILPTGRNFYAVDPRALPSQAAWRVGQQLAREAVERYRKEEGVYPEMMGLSVWGTSQMRTHGDDVAEAFALLGVRPVWDSQSRRLNGVAVIPPTELGRPRVDVTLRISGFFRDAFPHLIDLFDEAVGMVVELDEPLDQNFPRKHYLADLEKTRDLPIEEAETQARYRIFGSKPGSYGAGILPLIETGNWHDDQDFARAFLAWGGYAYGRGTDGVEAQPVFAERLRSTQVALHNQDNREHDIFDSDDYFQFHGGMIASIRALTGAQPKAYFGDSSRPESAQVRDLREEALRVYRSRVVNPKWIDSMRRHGYKGGLELAATVDYIFGYDATAQIAPDFVYQGLADNYALASEVREFLEASNPWALNAIAGRLLEAARRGLWEAPSPETLEALRGILLDSETLLEAQGERKREAIS